MGIYIKMDTKKQIGDEPSAHSFFDLLETNGLNIGKIGLFEPVKEAFTREAAVEMWTKEEPGIFDVSTNTMVGKAGGMIGKGKGFWFSSNWWQHPKEDTLNHVTLYMNKTFFNQKKAMVPPFFENLVNEFNAIYGYVAEEESIDRQHTTGNLLDRLPGVFWLNFYSPVFVDYLTKEQLHHFSWHNIYEQNEGIVTQLSKSPFDPMMAELEKQAQEAFGTSKFNGRAQDYPDILGT
ncbi:hypothetical protein [Pseudalkalibacillus sp. SCS-8]|uniref:hypothetical protein n=1 Tax=Pseudalkalibacillus nanhaiensis TaxID=3115291 RepID=UPI0032D9D5D0